MQAEVWADLRERVDWLYQAIRDAPLDEIRRRQPRRLLAELDGIVQATEEYERRGPIVRRIDAPDLVAWWPKEATTS